MAVSILVLMEVSFRHILERTVTVGTDRVSILVLMEVSFRQVVTTEKEVVYTVSILVLMEVSFRRPVHWGNISGRIWVSILVLMEVSFRLLEFHLLFGLLYSFNPCFNGSIFQTLEKRAPHAVLSSRFNPCFNGSIFQTIMIEKDNGRKSMFQSLF